MFIDEIARFSEKPLNGRFFVVVLQCQTRWRALPLMGICRKPNGSLVRYERLSFIVGGRSSADLPPFFDSPPEFHSQVIP